MITQVTFSAHPSAPEGEVRTLSLYEPSTFPPGSAILCRNTAPLVSFAYGLLQRDVPCLILGKDIGTQLITLVRKMRAQSLTELLERLELWRDREVEIRIAKDQSPDSVYDQFDCLRIFIDSLDEDSRTVASLIAKIQLLFDDTQSLGKVTLATIHKSKGLEWKEVFLLDWHLCPSRHAKLAWQLQQERNLQYVAVTRSMDKLFYIQSGSWKE